MNTVNSPDGPSRVEREILEILERAEAQTTPVEELQSAVRRRGAEARARMQAASPARSTIALSSDITRILAALALAIAAALSANISHIVGVTLAIASGVALLSLWFRTGPGRPTDGPRWRGQNLRDPRGPAPFNSGTRPPLRWPRRPGS
ncbi:MAG: hypothetical protein U0031_12900 [Thermomicrobiales bacterium]